MLLSEQQREELIVSLNNLDASELLGIASYCAYLIAENVYGVSDREKACKQACVDFIAKLDSIME